MTEFRSISPRQAEALVESGDAHVLDVRTPEEYERLGHIRGAWLLPVDLIASAPAVLPDDGRPVLVYCEHGVRSAAACEWLRQAGVSPLLNMAGGMSLWTGPREFGSGVLRGPSTWLLENSDLIPRGARVLDVACGRGRHALLLASAGLTVTAVDRDEAALARLDAIAGRAGLPLETRLVDLEAPEPIDFGSPPFDLVLVFHFLHRPLFSALADAVAPGGLLFYETFTAGQAERGHPRNPAYLLKPGELAGLVSPLHVIHQREGDFDGRLVASVVALKDRPRQEPVGDAGE